MQQCSSSENYEPVQVEGSTNFTNDVVDSMCKDVMPQFRRSFETIVSSSQHLLVGVEHPLGNIT